MARRPFQILNPLSYWSRLNGSLIGFRGADDSAEPVSPSNPLPVAVVSGGTGGGGTAPTPLRVLGSQELTLTAAAQALTVPAGATYAEIQVQGGDARVRYDGTNPTASTGILWTDGETWSVDTAAELQAFRAVSSSGSPRLFVTYRGGLNMAVKRIATKAATPASVEQALADAQKLVLDQRHLSKLEALRDTMQRQVFNPLDSIALALTQHRPDYGGLLREGLDGTFGAAWTFERAGSRTAPVFTGQVPANTPAFGLLSSTAPKLTGRAFDLDLFPFDRALADYGVTLLGMNPHVLTADGRLILSVGSSTELYRAEDGSNGKLVAITNPDPEAGRRMQAIHRSPSGALFACTFTPAGNSASTQGRMYRSADNGDTWSLVLDCGVAAPSGFNFACVGNRILASQYGPRLSVPPSELGWLSDDDGLTWRVVFRASDWMDVSDGVHLHYTGINPNDPNHFVITSGDGKETRRIFVSKDAGATWTQPLGRSGADLRTTSGVWEENGDLILGPDGYGDGGGFDIRKLTPDGQYEPLATLPSPSYKMVWGPLRDVWTHSTADPQAPPNRTTSSGIYYSPSGRRDMWLPVGAVDTIPTNYSTGILRVLEPAADGYLYAYTLNDTRNTGSYLARLNLRRVYQMGVSRPGDRSDERLTAPVSVPADGAWTMGCTMSFIAPRTTTSETYLLVLSDPTWANGWVLTCRNTGTSKQTGAFRIRKRNAGAAPAQLAVSSLRDVALNLTDTPRMAVVAVRRGPGLPLDLYVHWHDGKVERVTATEDAAALQADASSWGVGGHTQANWPGAGVTVAHPLLFNRALGDGEARALLADLMR